ncbi:hypothetical protein AXF42_Ash001647 [Apostasia shenzhenica]|uniref:IST1-like protein n=1 Tax=Apostasia shenzhenica TaxID=1088818 RepID=A0A2I0AAY1_9ASPA|nr:hypothetical protein AXF42_Ash001647 [Apostasia shenzhenica]
MFSSLLGRKFSNKCKHSVKCIRCRIETIRKKKQAMVRYLKKDVADLVAGGHDANAFGRMDALIVEINHVSCYDVIERYCICILEHLSTMQKERVCPEETVEAMATLIFAAARFSDLPELADLRCVFAERYGTYMEAYINEEFVEKLQSRTFSKDKKVQLMHDIAEEFTVNWDVKAFVNKISNPPPPVSNHSVRHMSFSNVNKKQSFSNGERVVTVRQDEVINGRKPGLSRTKMLEAPSPAIVKPKKPSLVNPLKNIEFVEEDQNTSYADPYEHHSKYYSQKEHHSKYDLQKQQVEVIYGRETELNRPEKLEAPSPAIIMPKKPSPVMKLKNIEIVKEENEKIIHSDRYELRSKCDLQKLQAQAEETRDLFTEKARDRSHDYMFDKSVPPYVKTIGNQNLFYTIEEICEESTRRRSESVNEGLGLINTEKQTATELVSREVKAVNMVPPYTKPSPHYDEFVDFTTPEVIKKIDRNGWARQHSASVNSNADNGASHLKPPYIQPNVTKTPLETGSVKQYEIASNAEDGVFPRGNLLEEQDAIFQQPKQKDNVDVDSFIGNDCPHMSRMPNKQRRRGGRGAATSYDADYDEEEEIVDKLLKHYSRKVCRSETRKTKILDKPHTTTRAVSLPPEPAGPVEKPETVARMHMRAASMQPDHLSNNGARVHPRLPDYDGLAARIAALRQA